MPLERVRGAHDFPDVVCVSMAEPVIFRNATIFGLAPRMRFDLAINVMTLRAWKDRVIYIMGGELRRRLKLDFRYAGPVATKRGVIF